MSSRTNGGSSGFCNNDISSSPLFSLSKNENKSLLNKQKGNVYLGDKRKTLVWRAQVAQRNVYIYLRLHVCSAYYYRWRLAVNPDMQFVIVIDSQSIPMQVLFIHESLQNHFEIIATMKTYRFRYPINL